MHFFQASLAGTISKPHRFHKVLGQIAIILLDININAKTLSTYFCTLTPKDYCSEDRQRKKPYNSTEIHR